MHLVVRRFQIRGITTHSCFLNLRMHAQGMAAVFFFTRIALWRKPVNHVDSLSDIRHLCT